MKELNKAYNPNSKGRLKAFTLMDVMTGMVIMSIIIAMVYYLFTSVNKQLYDYTKSRTELNAFLLMQSDLNWQTENTAAILRTPQGFTLNFNGSKPLEMIQNENILLRKSENTIDTFSTKIQAINYQLVMDEFGRETDVIKKITIESKVTEVTLRFDLEKRYSSADQINAQLIHVD